MELDYKIVSLNFDILKFLYLNIFLKLLDVKKIINIL